MGVVSLAQITVPSRSPLWGGGLDCMRGVVDASAVGYAITRFADQTLVEFLLVLPTQSALEI